MKARFWATVRLARVVVAGAAAVGGSVGAGLQATFGEETAKPAAAWAAPPARVTPGQRKVAVVTARSGSAKDIQAAADQVAAAGGGSVLVPAGTFDFMEKDEPWKTVTIPAGVSLFGSPTERDVKGQAKQWKTVLVMRHEVPGAWRDVKCWFRITGSGAADKPFRFSDIKLVGYRSLDRSSTSAQRAMRIEQVRDFRIDHCYFEHTWYGIFTFGGKCRGVIDHCFFVNKHGKVGAPLDACTVGYGVQYGREYGDAWEDDARKVLGQYTDYTVVVEDCYFEKWRHCVAGNSGGHMVFRHSTVKDDFGFGSLDAHGWGRMEGGKIVQVGTRAIEIYECRLLDPIQSPRVTMIRGGAGVAFHNTVAGYKVFIYFSREGQKEVAKCFPRDWWIWDNQLAAGVSLVSAYRDPDKGAPQQGVDYFLRAPNKAQDGWEYKPYPYPHPMTLEGRAEPPGK